jgi:hypothetical protein
MLRAGLFTLAVLTAASVSMASRPNDVSVHRDTRAELADVNLVAAVADAQEQGGRARADHVQVWRDLRTRRVH